MSDEFSTVQCVTKAQFNPASLNASYQVLNGTGFSDDAKILKIYNGSLTVAIDISLDGVNDHDFIPPLGTLIIDFQTNHYDGGTYGTGTLVVRKGQLLWGKIASQAAYLQIIGFR